MIIFVISIAHHGFREIGLSFAGYLQRFVDCDRFGNRRIPDCSSQFVLSLLALDESGHSSSTQCSVSNPWYSNNCRYSILNCLHIGWSLPHCQSVHCAEKGLRQNIFILFYATSCSNRFTYEPALCGNLGDSAPPIFLCNGCADSAQAEMPIRFLCHPLPNAISATCQNKGCSSSSRIAVGTCFDEDCIRSNGYLPLRLCQECFVALHPPETRATEHIRHSGQSQIWSIYPLENIMVEAVVKLLRETSAQLTELSSEGEAAKRPKWLRQLEAGRELGREVDQLSDERRMLSRFGIWLMAAHCPPVMEATSVEQLNYLKFVSFTEFHWLFVVRTVPMVCNNRFIAE